MDTKNVTGEEEGTKDMFCLDGRSMTLKIKPVHLNLAEESTDGESEVQNPLQNPLILHQVLSNLHNMKDLKNCRLVNSTWTDETSNFLKKKSIFKVCKGSLKASKENINSLEMFQPQNLLLFPTLDRNRPEYSKKDWGIVKKQIAKLSDGVKSLKFPNTEVPRPGGTQSFTEILHCNFPNLVQLTLGDSDFSWPDPPPPSIPSLKRIDWTINCRPRMAFESARLVLLEGVFKLAPNLESLKLRDKQFIRHYHYYFGFQPHANVFLRHFNNNPSSFQNLKDLELDYLSPSDVYALSDLKINLRSLKLPELPVMADQNIFEDFLKTQSGTLEELLFNFPFNPIYGTFYFTFPCLPKLKKLKLVHEGSPIRMKFQDVDYANQLPVLQRLVIKYLGGRGIKDRIWLTCPLYAAFLPVYGEDFDRPVCKTLRVLKLPYPSEPELNLEDKDLFGIRERLGIMFPNVHNEHLDIGRARVAEGHQFLPIEPVSHRTRSKANPAPCL